MYHKLIHSVPNGCENTEPILLTLDEYEVIRLVDLEQQTHEQCAAQMDISRSTVQEIYESRTAQDRSVSCPRETAAHHRGKLPYLRRTKHLSAEDRRQLTAAAAAGRREPTQKNPIKVAKENPL